MGREEAAKQRAWKVGCRASHDQVRAAGGCCSVCKDFIRGVPFLWDSLPCHFGCMGGEPDANMDLPMLRPCEHRALSNVREAVRHLHDAALPRLRERAQTLGFVAEDVDTTLRWIREEAPILIHVNLATLGAKLVTDTHYRNLFQTGTSSGAKSTEQRMRWEHALFGDAYDAADPSERCKYGVLNVTNDPQGVAKCHQYGTSYLLLRNCRLRTTFSAQDSGGVNIEDLATVDYHAHVLEKYEDSELRAALEVGTRRAVGVDSGAITKYKEAQIHGEVRLAEHVELIMAHPSLRGPAHAEMMQRLAMRCNAPVVWMETAGDGSGGAGPAPAHAAPRFGSALSAEDQDLALAIEVSRAAAADTRLRDKLAATEARELKEALRRSEAALIEEDKDTLMAAVAASLAPPAHSPSSSGSDAHREVDEEALAVALSASRESEDEEGALAIALSASRESEAAREMEEVQRALDLSTPAAVQRAAALEDEELARAICASLDMDVSAADRAPPALGVDHVVKASLGDDVRPLRAHWRDGAGAAEVLASICEAAFRAFGRRWASTSSGAVGHAFSLLCEDVSGTRQPLTEAVVLACLAASGTRPLRVFLE